MWERRENLTLSEPSEPKVLDIPCKVEGMQGPEVFVGQNKKKHRRGE